MLKKDQFHKDILDGLTLFYESRFIADIRNIALKYPASSLGNALNRRQTASKLWLLDSLFAACGGTLGHIHNSVQALIDKTSGFLDSDPPSTMSSMSDLDQAGLDALSFWEAFRNSSQRNAFTSITLATVKC